MKTKWHYLTSLVILSAFLLSGCDDPEQVAAERARLEAERAEQAAFQEDVQQLRAQAAQARESFRNQWQEISTRAQALGDRVPPAYREAESKAQELLARIEEGATELGTIEDRDAYAGIARNLEEARSELNTLLQNTLSRIDQVGADIVRSFQQRLSQYEISLEDLMEEKENLADEREHLTYTLSRVEEEIPQLETRIRELEQEREALEAEFRTVLEELGLQ